MSVTNSTDERLPRQPFVLLQALHGDDGIATIFSEERTVQCWLDVEVALARAEVAVGLLSEQEADQIAAAATLANVDLPALWEATRNVGYPILPLVRMVAAAAPPGADGRVHYGATTQDIMDTALVLQLSAAITHLGGLTSRLGDALARTVLEHRTTVMAARTHAQQAVPTTFGAKLASMLSEIGRHEERLSQLRPRLCVVSLFGAGGTSAALGPRHAAIRSDMAARLGLRTTDVPWHVARDALAELGLVCAAMSATCAKLAREVIDLSRTEVGEVRETDGHHRGASSTMPQKANPITSEAIIGMAVTATALSSAVLRGMEAGHERAAGEWQVEWQVLPQVVSLAAGCLANAGALVESLRVFPDAMRRNLEADGGLVMAEAYMFLLAPALGREVAHDLVYQAAKRTRDEGTTLREAVKATLPHSVLAELDGHLVIEPSDYLGSAVEVCDAAVAAWEQRPRPT